MSFKNCHAAYTQGYIVDRSIPEPNTGCWIWLGGLGDGYAKLSSGGNAHRESFRLFCGEVPKGYVVDHKCRNRACVNPDHLEAVTARENARRRDQHGHRLSNGRYA